MGNRPFEECYDLYAVMLYQIAFVHTGKREDAEELVQEVFVRRFANAPEFASEEHEKAWMIRVLLNLCKNQQTSAWKRRVEPKEEMSQYADKEVPDDVLQAVLDLPLDYKTVIYLHYYEGYRVEEIARILKVSVSAVKMRLLRGRKQLKLELSEEGGRSL